MVLERIELKPTNGRKSFYGKAQVEYHDNNTGEIGLSDRVLLSYGTKIMTIKYGGKMVRHWNGWTKTTGNHIASFADLNKKAFLELELV